MDLPQTPKHRQLSIRHPHVILGEVKGQKYTVMTTIKSSLLVVFIPRILSEREGREGRRREEGGKEGGREGKERRRKEVRKGANRCPLQGGAYVQLKRGQSTLPACTPTSSFCV